MVTLGLRELVSSCRVATRFSLRGGAQGPARPIRTAGAAARGSILLAGLWAALAVSGCRTTDRAVVPADGSAAPGTVGQRQPAGPVASIVLVSVVAQSSNFHSPWTALSPQRRRGLGTLVGPRRVLVTAMLVADAAFVELQRPAEGLRTTARVVARDYECNLALLEPEGAAVEFLKGLSPLALDDGVRVGDAVTAWQLEADGSAHRTEGQVSRIDVGAYPPYGRALLRYRFQGALKPIGGVATVPAVRQGRLAGLFMADSAEDQAATILPAPSIRRFLDDADRGEWRSFPFLGVASESTTDPALRRRLGLADDVGGAYVSRVVMASPAAAAGFRRGDVILAVDGMPVDRRKYYHDPDFGPLDFSHRIAGCRSAGDTLRFDVWRDGKALGIDVVLARKVVDDELIPAYWFDRPPRYVIHGGLYFTELTRPYLQTFRQINQAPVLLRYATAYPEEFSEGREALVILSQVIPTPATVGYERIGQCPVEEVNGQRIGSIRDLQEAFRKPIDGRHAIRCQGSPLPIYLDAALTERVNARLESGGVTPLRQLD